MKKILTTILAASMMLLGTQAFAQVSVGAGYKMLSHKTEKADPTNLNGAFVGVDYNIHLVGGLNVAPGIYYSFVTKSDASSFAGIASGKLDMNEHYLTVPVHFNYGFNLGNDIKAFVFAGPSVDFGLSRTIKGEGSVLGISGDKTTSLYDDPFNYGRFDVKLGGGIGVDILDVTRVKVGYDFGMLNTGSDNATMHSNQLYVGVSLLF